MLLKPFAIFLGCTSSGFVRDLCCVSLFRVSFPVSSFIWGPLFTLKSVENMCFSFVFELSVTFSIKKERSQQDKHYLQSNTLKTKVQLTRIPLKIGGELKCSWKVSSVSCSTCDTRRVTLVTNRMINHEWRKDRIMIMTNGTYPWSFVEHIHTIFNLRDKEVIWV